MKIKLLLLAISLLLFSSCTTNTNQHNIKDELNNLISNRKITSIFVKRGYADYDSNLLVKNASITSFELLGNGIMYQWHETKQLKIQSVFIPYSSIELCKLYYGEEDGGEKYANLYVTLIKYAD